MDANTDDLIPDKDDLFDGTIDRETFIKLGEGFVHNALIQRCGLKPSDYVLDLGSGNGQKARPLVRYLSSDGQYRGFDVVKHAVDWCTDRYMRFPNFQFAHADVSSDWYNPNSAKDGAGYKFPYPSRYFDIAFASSLFTHLQPNATNNYLKECARVLKPDGRLLSTWFLVTHENNGRHSQPIQGRHFIRVSDQHWHLDLTSPSRGVAYDEVLLRRMIETSGLIVSEICFGRWSKPTDILGALQDIIIAIRPAD